MNRVSFYMQIIWIGMFCQSGNYINRGVFKVPAAHPRPNIFRVTRNDPYASSNGPNQPAHRRSLQSLLYSSIYSTQGRVQEDFSGGLMWSYYRTYSTYSVRQAWANSVDPDQTPQNAASDQGLHCLPLIQHFYTHSQVVKWTCWREVWGKVSQIYQIYPKFPMKMKFWVKVGFSNGGFDRAPRNPSESAPATASNNTISEQAEIFIAHLWNKDYFRTLRIINLIYY